MTAGIVCLVGGVRSCNCIKVIGHTSSAFIQKKIVEPTEHGEIDGRVYRGLGLREGGVRWNPAMSSPGSHEGLSTRRLEVSKHPPWRRRTLPANFPWQAAQTSPA